jgi:hypothetical protein
VGNYRQECVDKPNVALRAFAEVLKRVLERGKDICRVNMWWCFFVIYFNCLIAKIITKAERHNNHISLFLKEKNSILCLV